MKLITILLFALITATCGQKPKANNDTFANPLLLSGPDPWVTKKGDTYYYTHTLGNRIAIWKTRKISELKNVKPQTIWTAPATGAGSKNVWAPELHFLNNKWYAYFTAGASDSLKSQRTFVLENSSEDPLSGTWINKGEIKDTAAEYFAIDGTVFSHNSHNYFIWSGHANANDQTQRIYIASMSNPWTLSSPRSLISSPEFAWESAGAPPSVNEAPEILQNPQGKIFLIYSAGGCWTDDYSLGLLALKDKGDPLKQADWQKQPGPVFVKNVSESAFGPGHNSFFTSADGSEDWIIYHANPTTGAGCGDLRSPRMQKFSWNADGTPFFGQPAALGALLKKPAGE